MHCAGVSNGCACHKARRFDCVHLHGGGGRLREGGGAGEGGEGGLGLRPSDAMLLAPGWPFIIFCMHYDSYTDPHFHCHPHPTATPTLAPPSCLPNFPSCKPKTISPKTEIVKTLNIPRPYIPKPSNPKPLIRPFFQEHSIAGLESGVRKGTSHVSTSQGRFREGLGV